MLTQTKPQSLFFLYLAVFINMVGFGMVFPLLPFYAETFAASPFAIGLMAASFSIVQFFVSPILGRISDGVGRKPVLVIALLAATGSMILMGSAKSFTWLFAARSFHGAIAAAIMPTARAYMADVTTKEDRIAGMGRIGAAFALGFLTGPALGSFMVSLGNIHTPFFAAALVAALNAFFIMSFLPESLETKAEHIVIKEGLLNVVTVFRSIRSEWGILFLVLFTWAFGLSNNQVSFPLLAGDRFQLGSSHIGYFFTAIAFTSAIVQGFFLGKIVPVLGEKKTIITGMIMHGAGLFFVGIAPNLSLLVPSLMVMTFGSALNRPTAEGIISKAAETGQGTALGVAHSFESLGRVFGPLSSGFLYGIGMGFPFFFSMILLWSVAMFAMYFMNYQVGQLRGRPPHELPNLTPSN